MRALIPLLLVAALLGGGCAPVQDALGSARDRIDDTSDTARFCLAVTRAMTSLDGGTSTDQASQAAEEVLTQVPDALHEDARTVAEALRRARDGDLSALDEAGFRDAATRLRDGARDRCDPTS